MKKEAFYTTPQMIANILKEENKNCLFECLCSRRSEYVKLDHQDNIVWCDKYGNSDNSYLSIRNTLTWKWRKIKNNEWIKSNINICIKKWCYENKDIKCIINGNAYIIKGNQNDLIYSHQECFPISKEDIQEAKWYYRT